MNYGFVLTPDSGVTSNPNSWAVPGLPLPLADAGAGARTAAGAAAAPPSPSPEQIEAAARAAYQAGERLRNLGEFGPARRQYAEALRLKPDKAELHFLVGACDFQLNRRDAGHRHLTSAIGLDPNFAVAHRTLANYYLQEGIMDAALEHSARAMSLAPQDDSIAAARALVLEVAGELEEAWTIIDRLIARGYVPSFLAVLYARTAAMRGLAPQALQVIASVLDTQTHLPVDEAALRFAAAELFDSLGQYDDAFAQVQCANQLKRGPYNPATSHADVDRLIANFTPERMRCLPRATYRSEQPVFIVGMPRSGTSLVEQMLASHPAVHGAGELDFINRVFKGTLDMLGTPVEEYPHCLDALSVASADGMAQIYLEPLRALNPAAARITDKMPLNFLHLGLIALLLPEARIIHCRRDPLDTCLSCHVTDFVTAHDYKYDLRHLGLFYRQYERLMAHWKATLDLPILDVRYEDLTSDTEAQARRMIDFVGLPWDERCLHPNKTRRPIATASAHQVRKPIYKSSVQRWRHYEKHLGPLIEALG
jgi:tetratricopeptide (TPR) repeat protein